MFLASLLLNIRISLPHLKVKNMNLTEKKKTFLWGIVRGSVPWFTTSDHRGEDANGARSMLALR